MLDSRLKEVLGLIVSNLESVSDMDAYNRVYGIDDHKVTGIQICELLYDAVARSDLRILKGVPHFFTGKIYEPVPYNLIDRAVELYLRRMRVRDKDFFYSNTRFVKKAHQSLELNNPLMPVFHIKAYRNGVVDMRDGILRPFSPEFHVVYLHDYEYDPKAKCPMWMGFLKSVLPEKESRLVLQMFLGLCTFDRGYMTDKVENCLMLYGSGSNGKSVIFETVTGIFGKPNVSGMGLLSMVKGGDERLRNIAAIDGKVVNVCPEIQARDISGYEDAFKSLCSGEPQYGRVIGGNVYMVRNIPWLIFNMNNIPKASDSSHGYFRRFLYVVFEYIIPDELQNKHLAEDLKEEYPGILNWIRRGAYYLKQRKYIFPKSENAEKQKLMVMGDSNVTFSWAIARGVRPTAAVKGELSSWVRASAMFEDMQRYAEVNGFEPCDITAFGRALTKYGFGKENRRRRIDGTYYKVFGCTEEELKGEVPVVADMDLTREDELDREVDYDKDDL